MNFNGWCPIISTTFTEGESKRKCIEDECAWFTGRKCVVFAMLDELSSIKSDTSMISSLDLSYELGKIEKAVVEIGKKK